MILGHLTKDCSYSLAMPSTRWDSQSMDESLSPIIFTEFNSDGIDEPLLRWI